MAKVRWPLIVALGAVGLVWLGQGVGVIGGSFMSGEPLWAGIGGAMLLAAIVLTTTVRKRG
jgi:hypothetical protein